ncbi:MAG: glutaredoxin 3 [Alphaproteobacteria bacterium]
MPKIIIYTKNNCPYCDKAIALLKMKNVKDVELIDATESEALREEMIQKSNGRRTFPQIFINNQHIGGFDDMNALNQKGELDKLLSLS